MRTWIVEDWLAPSPLHWPDRTWGPWTVTLTWRDAGDRAECSGFSLAPLDPKRTEPVTATLLRSLPITSLIAEARRARYDDSGGGIVEALAEGQDIDVGPGLEEELRRKAEPWREAGTRRLHLGPEHHHDVAAIYSSALAAHGHPLKAVQAHWTVSRPTASRWVAAAREAGFLPPTGRGRARGNDLGLTATAPDEEGTA